MRLFDQLEWKPHFKGKGGEQAVMEFDNGWRVSVLRGDGPRFYSEGGTYEIGARQGSFYTEFWEYQTEEQAEVLLQSIKAMPADKDADNA